MCVYVRRGLTDIRSSVRLDTCRLLEILAPAFATDCLKIQELLCLLCNMMDPAIGLSSIECCLSSFSSVLNALSIHHVNLVGGSINEILRAYTRSSLEKGGGTGNQGLHRGTMFLRASIAVYEQVSS
eukprot:Filipodium_phascolosomae@DN3549_c0_g1_i1.p1